jgi:antirestriction protein ArdC
MRDIYQNVTDQIVAELKAGARPWRARVNVKESGRKSFVLRIRPLPHVDPIRSLR